jgi:hypothetical protein
MKFILILVLLTSCASLRNDYEFGPASNVEDTGTFPVREYPAGR